MIQNIDRKKRESERERGGGGERSSHRTLKQAVALKAAIRSLGEDLNFDCHNKNPGKGLEFPRMSWTFFNSHHTSR